MRIGFFGALTLVALRVVIGLHFFLEGADKLGDPKFASSGFLANAKGPLASLYSNMVWDKDGLYRLSFDHTVAYWDNFKNRVVSHFGFDDVQTKEANKTFKAYDDRLRAFLGSHQGDIDEYSKQLVRRDENAKKPARELASLQAQDAKITAERMKLRGELLPTIDRMWKDYENDLNAISSEEQYRQHGRLAIGKIGTRFGDSAFVDQIIPWFDMIVGGCLVLGLLTRPAALAGGLFLLSVCASQWPGSLGAAPIYYQAVEMVAMFVLAAVGAGQCLGVDYLFSGLIRKREPANQPATQGR
jgi:uncharacterized membrane protein YphA (DoxX/SURF4 family)